MKTTIFLKTVLIVCIVLYAVLVFLFGFKNMYFSLFCLFCSVPIVLKGLIYKIDSSVFLGFLLFFTYFLPNLSVRVGLTIEIYYPVYILTISFASLMVFAIFRQKIHLKMFAITLAEVILLFIYNLEVIENYVFVLLQIILLIIVFASLFKRIKINTRRV